jgi:hypothetical protein
MAIVVENPSSMFTESAYALYNSIKNADLPQASGRFGIDAQVRTALIELARTAVTRIGLQEIHPNNMTGLCIWAGVVTTKFFVMRNCMLDSHLVRVRGDTGRADHYFVVSGLGTPKIIADITCGQFSSANKAAPDFIIGSLPEIKSIARGIGNVFGKTLYDAYAVGAAAKTFVI